MLWWSQRRSDSGCTLTGRAIRICWLDVGSKERRAENAFKILTGAIGRLALPSSEIRKTVDGAGLGGKIWYSYLKILSLDV